MFAFKCEKCDYGLALSSGVPMVCPICHTFASFRRVSHEEYHECKTNDGVIKEV